MGEASTVTGDASLAHRPAVHVKRRMVSRESNAAVDRVDEIALGEAVLKDGKRVRRAARRMVIVDPKTRNYHHQKLTIEEHRTGINGTTRESRCSITLQDDAEIASLVEYLTAAPELPPATGNFLIVPMNHGGISRQTIGRLLDAASMKDLGSIIAEMLARTDGDPEAMHALARGASKETLQQAVAALNVARFSDAVRELESLVQSSAREGAFQKLLTANPWMFGSEYCELLTDKRHLTRDEQVDFVQRRTVDGYIEIIEIKTPLNGAPLFLEDDSHKNLYPRSELTQAIAQVMKYLDEIDSDKYRIQEKDGVKVTRLCAKVIIGCDGGPKQLEALRRFNGHLHRIEVLTFDYLLRIARQVLSYAERVLAPTGTTPA